MENQTNASQYFIRNIETSVSTESEDTTTYSDPYLSETETVNIKKTLQSVTRSKTIENVPLFGTNFYLYIQPPTNKHYVSTKVSYKLTVTIPYVISLDRSINISIPANILSIIMKQPQDTNKFNYTKIYYDLLENKTKQTPINIEINDTKTTLIFEGLDEILSNEIELNEHNGTICLDYTTNNDQQKYLNSIFIDLPDTKNVQITVNKLKLECTYYDQPLDYELEKPAQINYNTSNKNVVEIKQTGIPDTFTCYCVNKITKELVKYDGIYVDWIRNKLLNTWTLNDFFHCNTQNDKHVPASTFYKSPIITFDIYREFNDLSKYEQTENSYLINFKKSENIDYSDCEFIVVTSKEH